MFKHSFFGRPVAAALLGASLISALPMSASAEIIDSPEAYLEQVNKRIKNITSTDLEAMLEKDPGTVVIDVRNTNEILLLGGMIDAPRIYNIPRGWLEFRIGELDISKDTPIVVYCGTNLRSPLAAETLMNMGYSNVANLADGVFVWRDSGLPMESLDQYLSSMLYSKPVKVAEGVWSSIGATERPSYENSGHNNNLSFVITNDGVLVVNASENYLLARALHEEIKQLTDQPVRYVVLENGQSHAAMGAAYWKEQGATIIAHADADASLRKSGASQLDNVLRRTRDKGMGTRLVLPDETFDDKRVIEMGGRRIELLHFGPAHSPGDISVWLPQDKVMIAGDIAFHQRMPPIFEKTDTAAWLETWKTFEQFDTTVVVPGHGVPTDMATVTRYTRDYLLDLRGQIAALLEEGGSLEDIHKIDQSAWRHLDTFDELARLNASIVFRAMEFE